MRYAISYHVPLLVILLVAFSSRCQAANDETDSWMTAIADSASSSSSSSSSLEQFSCTLAAKDESSCAAATADDGTHCVWCSVSGLGFCVTEAQAKKMEKVIPTIKCENGPTPKTDDAVHPPTVAPSGDDPNHDIWDCLDKKDQIACHKDAKDSGSKCTWCVSKIGYGLCLAPVEADFASQSKWYHCDARLEDDVMMPNIDTTCLMASLEQDASVCESTLVPGGQNEKCKWCHVASAPILQVCLAADQASWAGALISCDQQQQQVDQSKDVAVQDPLDLSCVEASMIQDETVCESTVDVSGQACEWCAIPHVPYHVCLSKDQVNLVSGFVECSKPPSNLVIESSTAATTASAVSTKTLRQKKFSTKLLRSGTSATSNLRHKPDGLKAFDASCLMSSLAQDASICQATNDATTGEKCEWCHAVSAPSLHLCLSSEQATMATGLVSCDAIDEKRDTSVEDPTDLTCLEASLLQDESACESTADTSGQACEYCSVPNLPFHVCLSQEQATLVAGLVTCSNGPSSAPASAIFYTKLTQNNDKAASYVDFPPDLIKCLHSWDEAGCEKSACTWCDTQIGFGICLAKEAAAATDNCPFFDCDGPTNTTTTFATLVGRDQDQLDVVSSSATTTTTTTTATTSSPDVNCWAAGMASNDAQSVCQTTLDHQGSTCVWCDAAGSGFGLCLSPDQAKVAGKWLDCSSSSSDVTAIKN